MGTSLVKNGGDRLIGTFRVTAAINAHVGTFCTCRFSGDQVLLAMLMLWIEIFHTLFAPKLNSLNYFFV
jgi:hypothetical protein